MRTSSRLLKDRRRRGAGSDVIPSGEWSGGDDARRGCADGGVVQPCELRGAGAFGPPAAADPGGGGRGVGGAVGGVRAALRAGGAPVDPAPANGSKRCSAGSSRVRGCARPSSAAPRVPDGASRLPPPPTTWCDCQGSCARRHEQSRIRHRSAPTRIASNIPDQRLTLGPLGHPPAHRAVFNSLLAHWPIATRRGRRRRARAGPRSSPPRPRRLRTAPGSSRASAACPCR